MATITLKDIPVSLHRELKQRAKSHGRSLNREILRCLESCIYSRPLDVDQVLHDALEIREQVQGYLTEQDLKKFKSKGRP